MATSASRQAKTAPKTPLPQPPETELEEAAPAAKKRRSLPKIVLLLALPLAAAAGGTWYFLHDQQPAPAASPKPGAAKLAAAKPASTKPPVFVTLEPFTVNLQQTDGTSQYLQVGLSLKVSDDALVDAIKLHMPEIRNRVLLLLSSKNASEISTLEGKKTLSTELTKEIVQPLAGRVPAQGLDSVLFTSFVIQ